MGGFPTFSEVFPSRGRLFHVPCVGFPFLFFIFFGDGTLELFSLGFTLYGSAVEPPTSVLPWSVVQFPPLDSPPPFLIVRVLTTNLFSFQMHGF